jgi:hypothetical protein
MEETRHGERIRRGSLMGISPVFCFAPRNAIEAVFEASPHFDYGGIFDRSLLGSPGLEAGFRAAGADGSGACLGNRSER